MYHITEHQNESKNLRLRIFTLNFDLIYLAYLKFDDKIQL